MQILQERKPNDGPKCKAFALEMLSRINDDKDYLKKVMFTDEACFHVSGKVNRHNVRRTGALKTPTWSLNTYVTVQQSMCGVAFSITVWWVPFSMQRIQ